MKPEKKIHYAISAKNAGPTLCGRFIDRQTRVKAVVNCKECLRRMEPKSENSFYAEFVGD